MKTFIVLFCLCTMLFAPLANAETPEELSKTYLRNIMKQAARLGQLNFEKVEVLGSVSEGDSIYHVVARTHFTLAEMNMESVQVISFRKSDQEWRVLLQGKFKGIALQIKKALEANKALKP
jgi:hypothetical protein